MSEKRYAFGELRDEPDSMLFQYGKIAADVLARFGDSSHVCGLARAILLDHSDATKWGILLDAVGEAFNAFPDVERERERFAAEIRDAAVAWEDGGEHPYNILFRKLIALGHGAAVSALPDIMRPPFARRAEVAGWIGEGTVDYRYQSETLDAARRERFAGPVEGDPYVAGDESLNADSWSSPD